MSAMPAPTVTPEDIAQTDAWWRQSVPRYRAEWFTSGAPNEQAARRALDELVTKSNKTIATLAAQVQGRQLDAAGFEAAVGLLVKRCHIAAVALARGGAARIRLTDLQDDGL